MNLVSYSYYQNVENIQYVSTISSAFKEGRNRRIYALNLCRWVSAIFNSKCTRSRLLAKLHPTRWGAHSAPSGSLNELGICGATPRDGGGKTEKAVKTKGRDGKESKEKEENRRGEGWTGKGRDEREGE